MRSFVKVLVVVALVLSACGSDSGDAASSSGASTTATTAAAPVTTAAPATTAAPSTATAATATTVAPTTTEAPPTTAIRVVEGTGAEARSLMVGGVERGYILYVPADLPADTPAPLVVSAHGLWEDAPAQTYRNFHKDIGPEGVVVAYPQTLQGWWDLTGTSDVEFFEAMLDDIETTVSIDPGQVYVIGHSMGGELATYLACHLPDKVTAVASVAILHHHNESVCDTSAPVRLMALLGRRDIIYSIKEGLTLDPIGTEDIPGPLSKEAAAFAAVNDCETEPAETDLGEGATLWDYSCSGDSELMIYFHDGGHVWPAGHSGLEANPLIWEFLKQYTSPIGR